jgi:hypothetical protein
MCIIVLASAIRRTLKGDICSGVADWVRKE